MCVCGKMCVWEDVRVYIWRDEKRVRVQGRCLRGHVDLMVNQLLNKLLQLNMW